MHVVYDDVCGGHLRGIPHPESSDRVEMVAALLHERGMLADRIPARDATLEELGRVHDSAYLALVRAEVDAMRRHAGYLSTGDTLVDARSWDAALRAAGGAVAAAEFAAANRQSAFALVRPPGHHAEAARGMGFCLFNNAAVAARAVQAQTGLRVLVVDVDYHHGNGTQAVSGSGLSYVSTHGFPAYPGTGGPDENERLAGGDAIINLPLPPHRFGTEAFLAVWERLLPAVVRAVRPQMLVVSAGFDYVAGDPVGDLGVAPEAAADLAALVRRVAEEYCDGRAVYVLEGGYDVPALATSIAGVVEAHRAVRAAAPRVCASAVPEAQARVMDRIVSALA